MRVHASRLSALVRAVPPTAPRRVGAHVTPGPDGSIDREPVRNPTSPRRAHIVFALCMERKCLSVQPFEWTVALTVRDDKPAVRSMVRGQGPVTRSVVDTIHA